MSLDGTRGASFDQIRLERRFSELHGLVLLDPERLDAMYEQQARDADLLTRFTESEDGDRVSREGIAIPMLGLEPAYYTVVLRDVVSPGVTQAPRVRSPGWILGTETGRLLLCGLGYLVRWDPADPEHGRIQIPPGWYRVEILGHVLRAGKQDEEWLLEIVMEHTGGQQPPFTGDVSLELSLAD
jgi:hypothetical protein